MMPATWVPCDALTRPMLTKSATCPSAHGSLGREVDVLAVLHHERHPLADGGRRVVDAEVTDALVHGVARHHRLVGEVVVHVAVHPDAVVGRVVEDGHPVVGVTVAVDVAGELGSPRVRLVEPGEQEVARRCGPVGTRGPERRAGHRPVHLQPGPVTVDQRVGGREPASHLRLSVRGGLECGVVEVDTGVEDTDGDSAAVPGLVVVDEVGSADLADRQVGVVSRGLGAGCGHGLAATGALGGLRVRDPVAAVEVDRPHVVEGGEVTDRVDRHRGADVAEVVLGPTEGAPRLGQCRRDLVGVARRHREQDRHGLVASRLGLLEQARVAVAELLAEQSGAGGRRERLEPGVRLGMLVARVGLARVALRCEGVRQQPGVVGARRAGDGCRAEAARDGGHERSPRNAAPKGGTGAAGGGCHVSPWCLPTKRS